MLSLVTIILSILINPNLRIIIKRITKMENFINNVNLTESNLKFAKDRLHSLKIHCYGIIIREPL